MSYQKQTQLFRGGVAKLFKPPPDLTVAEWSSEYRYLSNESSALAGRYDLSRTPHCELPMTLLSPKNRCKRVLLPWSSQIAKTTVAENFIGYIMHQDPAPILVVQPNVEPMGKAFSTDRLAPMIRDTPALTDLVKDSDKRNSGNTIGRKTFPGGFIAIAGANSPAGLASRPIRYLVCDELNRWESTKEGNSLLLARKRLARFPNSKELTVSSRTYDGIGIDAEVFGAIDDDGERGDGADQIYYWSLACLKCGEYQYPEFKHLKFENRDVETITYECESCGNLHGLDQEEEIKRTGKYILKHDEGVEIVALFANTLGALICEWRESVQAFLSAQGDPDKLQVVVNTDFNETWKDLEGDGIQGNELYERRETYADEVPEGAKVLTFGADIQADRIECEVVGWSEDEESWSIDYQIFDGDTSSTKNHVWDDFKEYLTTEFEGKDRKLTLSAGVIDAGYLPSVVHSFVKSLTRRYVWAGIGRAGKRSIVESKELRQLRLRKSRSKKKKSEIIGTDEAKTVLYSRLKLKQNESGITPGYCHFPINPKYDPEHFEQLTAERVVRKLIQGQTTLKWVLNHAGQRNEPLDCRVYSHAALRLMSPKWSRLQGAIKETPEAAIVKPITRRGSPLRKKRTSGFVTSW